MTLSPALRIAFLASEDMNYTLTGAHVSADHALDARPVRVTAMVDAAGKPAFIAGAEGLGCSRDYATPRAAVASLAVAQACTSIVIDPACDAACAFEAMTPAGGVERAEAWIAAHSQAAKLAERADAAEQAVLAEEAAAIVRAAAVAGREDRGDAHATADELAAILADPHCYSEGYIPELAAAGLRWDRWSFRWERIEVEPLPAPAQEPADAVPAPEAAPARPTLSPALVAAFRHHRQERRNLTPAAALRRAREDVAAGRTRFPLSDPLDAVRTCSQNGGPRYVPDTLAVGLRLVGQVRAERGGCSNWRARHGEDAGWFTDPHGDVFQDGSGLCAGEVYQLPSRRGVARFVAGYRMGGSDTGPTLDLRNVRTGSTATWNRPGAADELGAARRASGDADEMARRAAEEERDYQAAWAAGARHGELAEEVRTKRAEALALLREVKAGRKAARATPALCRVVRESIRQARHAIGEARREMAELREEFGESPAFGEAS